MFKVKNGNILRLNLGTKLDGYYGDGAVTIGIGEISERDKELISCSKDALNSAIDGIRLG